MPLNEIENTPPTDQVTERANLPLMSSFIEQYNLDNKEACKHTPSKEVRQKSIDSEISMLVNGVDRLVDYVILNDVSTLVLLDKSARYIRPLFETRFKIRNLDREKYPSFCFINIGLEKSINRDNFEEKYLEDESQIESLRRAYSKAITSKSKICVVDDCPALGNSLACAKLILQKAFPLNPVSATYAFNDSPLWYVFDELKDVTDPVDLDEHDESLFTIATPSEISREFRNELVAIAKIPLPLEEINKRNEKIFLPDCISTENREILED